MDILSPPTPNVRSVTLERKSFEECELVEVGVAAEIFGICPLFEMLTWIFYPLFHDFFERCLSPLTFLNPGSHVANKSRPAVVLSDLKSQSERDRGL